jgi:hypothetical protein
MPFVSANTWSSTKGSGRRRRASRSFASCGWSLLRSSWREIPSRAAYSVKVSSGRGCSDLPIRARRDRRAVSGEPPRWNGNSAAACRSRALAPAGRTHSGPGPLFLYAGRWPPTTTVRRNLPILPMRRYPRRSLEPSGPDRPSRGSPRVRRGAASGLARSDHDGARARYEEALPLYRRGAPSGAPTRWRASTAISTPAPPKQDLQ